MNEYNPIPELLSISEKEVRILKKAIQLLSGSVEWYESTSQKEIEGKISLVEDEKTKYQQIIAKDVKLIKNCKVRLSETKTKSLFNPVNWFDEQQKEVRRKKKRIKLELESLEYDERQHRDQMRDSERLLEKYKKECKRYASFDLDGTRSEIREKNSLLKDTELRIGKLQRKRIEVDKVLAPILRELELYKSEKSKELSVMSKAESYDRELSSASNSYERAMIHERCEIEFGNGRPSRIISNARKRINQIESDMDKTIIRLEEISRKASRIIESIIVDGNNLCYQGNDFIGLLALKAILPVLAKAFEVTVVFDAGIRNLLKARDDEISMSLGDSLKVHVVATKQKADLTLLKLAEGCDFTYILSNDRFGEFREMDAVRSNRLIRHEIVNGVVMVHDFSLQENMLSCEL